MNSSITDLLLMAIAKKINPDKHLELAVSGLKLTRIKYNQCIHNVNNAQGKAFKIFNVWRATPDVTTGNEKTTAELREVCEWAEREGILEQESTKLLLANEHADNTDMSVDIMTESKWRLKDREIFDIAKQMRTQFFGQFVLSHMDMSDIQYRNIQSEFKKDGNDMVKFETLKAWLVGTHDDVEKTSEDLAKLLDHARRKLFIDTEICHELTNKLCSVETSNLFTSRTGKPSHKVEAFKESSQSAESPSASTATSMKKDQNIEAADALLQDQPYVQYKCPRNTALPSEGLPDADVYDCVRTRSIDDEVFEDSDHSDSCSTCTITTVKTDQNMDAADAPLDESFSQYERPRNTKCRYVFELFTSDKRKAGTEAAVFVQLFGASGKTQQVILKPSRNRLNKGSAKEYIVELEDIGDTIKKLQIGHDNKGWKPGWHLAKVAVKRWRNNELQPTDVHTFRCNRWLADNKGDCNTECELVADEIIGARQPNVTLKKYFADMYFSGALPSKMFLTLFGKKCESSKLRLRHSSKTKVTKQQKQFRFQLEDLGDIFKIEFEFKHSSQDWKLHQIEISSDSCPENYTFYCERKLRAEGLQKTTIYEKRYSGDIVCEEMPLVHSPSQSSVSSKFSFRSHQSQQPCIEYAATPTIPYDVIVKTGDREACGTDCHIYIRVFGQHSHGRVIFLEKQSDRFERGRKDVIQVPIEDIYPITKLEVWHDEQGTRPHWFLDQIELRNRDSGERTVFRANDWFSAKKGDKKTRRLLLNPVFRDSR